MVLDIEERIEPRQSCGYDKLERNQGGLVGGLTTYTWVLMV